MGLARDGDAVRDGRDVGSWSERRLVVDLAAGMESHHDSTKRINYFPVLHKKEYCTIIFASAGLFMFTFRVYYVQLQELTQYHTLFSLRVLSVLPDAAPECLVLSPI